MARRQYPPMVCKARLSIINGSTGGVQTLDMAALTQEQKYVVANELNRNAYNAVYSARGRRAEFKQGERRLTDVFSGGTSGG